ncbi:MAG: DUF885 domain-containing protein, partial [Actinomycetes bacterium]
MTSSASATDFTTLARRTLDGLLERHPDLATTLGDHRFDDRLPDLSAPALDDEVRWINDRLADLAAVDEHVLGVDEQVDRAIL